MKNIYGTALNQNDKDKPIYATQHNVSVSCFQLAVISNLLVLNFKTYMMSSSPCTSLWKFQLEPLKTIHWTCDELLGSFACVTLLFVAPSRFIEFFVLLQLQCCGLTGGCTDWESNEAFGCGCDPSFNPGCSISTGCTDPDSSSTGIYTKVWSYTIL